MKILRQLWNCSKVNSIKDLNYTPSTCQSLSIILITRFGFINLPIKTNLQFESKSSDRTMPCFYCRPSSIKEKKTKLSSWPSFTISSCKTGLSMPVVCSKRFQVLIENNISFSMTIWNVTWICMVEITRKLKKSALSTKITLLPPGENCS